MAEFDPHLAVLPNERAPHYSEEHDCVALASRRLPSARSCRSGRRVITSPASGFSTVLAGISCALEPERQAVESSQTEHMANTDRLLVYAAVPLRRPKNGEV